jgi:hypothetical protein
MIRLARHQREAEKKEHPLDRIISIEDDVQGIVINTTDIIRRVALATRSSAHFTARLRTISRKTDISCA